MIEPTEGTLGERKESGTSTQFTPGVEKTLSNNQLVAAARSVRRPVLVKAFPERHRMHIAYMIWPEAGNPGDHMLYAYRI